MANSVGIWFVSIRIKTNEVISLEDKEDLRKALLELLGEEENGRIGKRFFFPQNVEKGYNIIQGLSLTDIVKFIVPSVLVSAIILLMPPYMSLLFWIVKSVFACVILGIGFILAIARPVKYRNNIKFLNYIKMRISFLSKQKLYYIRPKDRGGI